MSDAKKPDSKHSKFSSQQIMYGTIAVAVLLMLILVPLGVYSPSAPNRHNDDVEIRIAPVAKNEIKAPVAAAATGGAAVAQDGATVYNTVCGACHGSGVAGAPKAGDKAAWGPRIALGKEALYKSAIQGKNAMPPRGGGATLSDAEVKGAVDHLLGL